MALILVTGTSTGLGLGAATTLRDGGHDVIWHARTADRLASEGVPACRMVLGDLADRDQVEQVAEHARSFGTVDAVIHNAGVLDGADVIPVNVIAPYLLTALMPVPARVIVLSSSMHLSGRPDVTPVLTGHGGSYSDSKLLVTTFALAMAARYPDVLAHAVDPGWVPTRMGGPSAPDDLTEGHRTQTWLATAPANEITPRSGGYWHHHATRRPHPAAQDPTFQQELLTALITRTGVHLPEPTTRPHDR